MACTDAIAPLPLIPSVFIDTLLLKLKVSEMFVVHVCFSTLVFHFTVVTSVYHGNALLELFPVYVWVM